LQAIVGFEDLVALGYEDLLDEALVLKVVFIVEDAFGSHADSPCRN
jgi:hypothetical protein